MLKHDYDAFAKALDSAYDSLGKTVMGSSGKAIFFKALTDVSMEQFVAALTAHLNDTAVGMFAPTVAHIRAQLEKFRQSDGRPSVEEAWALALKSQDEAVTVVLTAEIAEAMGICRPILDAGDKFGARMAFKEVYPRIVERARQNNTPTHWFASLGWDKEGREQPLLEAYRLNRLPKAAVAGLLPSVPSRTEKALPAPKSTDEEIGHKEFAQKLSELAEKIRCGGSFYEKIRKESRIKEEARKSELNDQVEMLMRKAT